MAAKPATSNARKQWEAENGVKPTSNEYWKVDHAKQKALMKESPWKNSPRYFERVHISALALIKIVMHAKTGQGKAGIISSDKSNWVEVMGLLQGHFKEKEFIITDSFAIPVEANEVECSLGEAAQIYMINYCETQTQLKKPDDKTIGWYHSHPGYSCYLSGTDVPTQQTNQTHQDPYIALVVDPVQTLATGRVEIKAFRTFPPGHEEKGGADWDADGVPEAKIKEFGAHFAKYYEVPIHVFRSDADAVELDLLWNKYWMQTLAASPLASNRHFTDGRLEQLLRRVDKADTQVQRGAGIPRATGFGRSRRAGGASAAGASAAGTGGDRDPMEPLVKTAAGTTNEVLQGLLAMAVKQSVFHEATPVAQAPQ
jgi:COP9 signalosome complex subunit 5